MKRRGILGGLLGAPIAAQAAARNAQQQSMAMASRAPAHVGQARLIGEAVSEMVHPRKDVSEAYRLFDEAMQTHRRRMERLDAMVACNGGLPPHLSTMHSNAQWFRVQRYLAWRDNEDRIVTTAREELIKRFLKPLGLR